MRDSFVLWCVPDSKIPLATVQPREGITDAIVLQEFEFMGGWNEIAAGWRSLLQHPSDGVTAGRSQGPELDTQHALGRC
jgi:biotin synthase-like enzyme